MRTVAYKCPCCASPLTFDGDSGKMKCIACATAYEVADIEALFAPQEESGVDFETPSETFGAQDQAQIQGYNCQTCGAELITEGSTTATECPYCGSPTILPQQIEGGVKPEMVVPFVVKKEEAQKQFQDYFKGKKLLPNVFLKGPNTICEMRRLFVPYWLFNCDAQGHMVFEAEKKRVTREGDWEVTTTEHYLVNRAGSMSFENIPVDGSEKLDDKITESMEPYDLTAAVPFQPAMLSGALADHADVDAVACEKRAVERVENSVAQSLRSTVTGYTSVNERSRRITSQGGKVTPTLLPLWLITTQKEGKTYTFAINGQTGKLACDVPADKKKSFLWGAGTFCLVFAVIALILSLMGMMDSGTLLMGGIGALIAAVVVVLVLIGQLKQASLQSAAAEYMKNFQLQSKYDHYLYTNTTRRKVETPKAEEKQA